MNDHQLPQRMKSLQDRVRDEVERYLAQHTPEDSVLVLDSTGPIATRHYLVLSAIGRERLLRFREVHVFSGGAFAIFGFLGLTSGSAKLRYPELRSSETEKLFRGFHHQRPLSVPHVVWNLMRRKSAFESNAPVRAMLAHIFTPQYMAQPFAAFPANVVLHMGRKGQPSIVPLSNGPLCDAACMPLREQPLSDAIIAAVTVPMVYGRKDGQDQFFDAVYAGGYSQALRKTTQSSLPTLVSTPWRSGQKGPVYFVNCFPAGNQKVEMFKDFGRLVFNLPNRGWGDDIYAAFES
jgi:hypothetical protein